jgi:hypothetical protein
MIKEFLKIVIVIFALIGMVNVYNSTTFQKAKASILKNNKGTICAIGDVVKDVTHSDSIKK